MKYLNGVLTVIAFCLVLITFAVTGVIPAANAKGTEPKFVSVPLNPDGSITVKMAKGTTIDVNIEEVGGQIQTGSPLEVNIEEVGGHSTHGTIPVEIEK